MIQPRINPDESRQGWPVDAPVLQMSHDVQRWTEHLDHTACFLDLEILLNIEMKEDLRCTYSMHLAWLVKLPKMSFADNYKPFIAYHFKLTIIYSANVYN